MLLMLTILFLLLHLARNMSWIIGKLASGKRRNGINQSKYENRFMRNRQGVKELNLIAEAETSGSDDTPVSGFRSGIMDENSCRQEMSRLSIAAELSDIKRSA